MHTLKIGHGFDIHPLVEGRPCIIGGVHIPFNKGLQGHSDADVLTHAITDAILGALAMGSIGDWFPDTDPAYKDADSIELLKEIYKVKSSQLNDKKVPPILLKVAPDITNKMVEDIINLALKYKIDGLIVGNTTISRPSSLQHHSKNEAGGLSGKPLFELSTKILAQFYIVSEGRINLIGSGGVDGVETAYAKIKAGATLIQVYTGLMYRGPELFRIIFDGLGNSLREDGFANIKDAIGVDAHIWH